MRALSMGRHLAYVFGAGSNLAEPRISGVSEIKCVDRKECPVGDQKDKIKTHTVCPDPTILLPSESVSKPHAALDLRKIDIHSLWSKISVFTINVQSKFLYFCFLIFNPMTPQIPSPCHWYLIFTYACSSTGNMTVL